ncbi:MAG: hypothetical protein A2X49_00480 [Lentisphaerae bacterium GWF2_52_8]|nr:MAG: hypothetical protein A2X49_00480 [Lentisphaerae bacterium GWF2_52_8]
MIDFQNVSKSYGSQELLREVSFRVNPSERVGIVGPNGAGKSTIFGLITTEIDADRGNISLPDDARIGYLRQHLPPDSAHVPLVCFTSDALREVENITKRVHEIEAGLSTAGPDSSKMLIELGHLQTALEHLGAYNMKNKAEAALSGLGFKADDFEKAMSAFSGGWQMRAALARVLIAEPDILLLDEPSNYLDIPAVEWLCRFLKNFNGTLLLISHDRFLLKALTNITIEVNSGQVTRYPGNYDYYAVERENRRRRLEAARRNQDRKREQLERGIERFRAKNTKAAQAHSWQKRLDKMDEIELPDSLHYTGSIRIPPPPHCGAELIRLEQAGLSYDNQRWILRNVELSINRGEKIGVVGYNGTGKTTLLRLLAGQHKPSEGRCVLGHKVVIGYQAQDFGEILPPGKSVFDIVRAAAPEASTAQEARTILGSFGFSGDDSEKPCAVLSGGEKIRLCFARIFINPPNLLILDEPTTHLDIAACEALQAALSAYEGTVILVSHDIEFVRGAASTILSMTPPGISRFCGNYDYFREKTRAENSAALPEAKEDDLKDLKKQRRQERAKRRQEMQQDKKAAERAVANCETAIEKLESEKLSLLKTLEKNAPGLDYAAINRRMTEIHQEIEAQTVEWEAAAVRQEAIQKEYDAIHED